MVTNWDMMKIIAMIMYKRPDDSANTKHDRYTHDNPQRNKYCLEKQWIDFLRVYSSIKQDRRRSAYPIVPGDYTII